MPRIVFSVNSQFALSDDQGEPMASIRKRTLPSGKQVWIVDYKDQTGKRRNQEFRPEKGS